jgi:hypothetical protein
VLQDLLEVPEHPDLVDLRDLLGKQGVQVRLVVLGLLDKLVL